MANEGNACRAGLEWVIRREQPGPDLIDVVTPRRITHSRPIDPGPSLPDSQLPWSLPPEQCPPQGVLVNGSAGSSQAGTLEAGRPAQQMARIDPLSRQSRTGRRCGPGSGVSGDEPHGPLDH